jgi:antitoxin component of RelBE/YafQ-DinJ toxin-antitoxin module
VDLALFSLWSLSLWRIQSSKRRVEQVCAKISLDLHDVAQEFLLAVAQNTIIPFTSEGALHFAADRIDKAMKELVAGSRQTFQQLEATNQQAVSALQGLNDDIRRRVNSFDQEIAPAFLSFQADITSFRSAVHDYEREMTRANNDLVQVLQTIATTNNEHLDLEQSLRQQIGALNSLQQMAVTRTEAIAASMSATAQSIVHIADQLANQPQQISIEAQGEVSVNVARFEARSDFDVYLCHDGKDTPAVKAIAEQLKQQGIKPWLDEWEIPPGTPWQSVLEQQIGRIRSVAVFLGQDERGPWQNIEQRSILQEFVERGCPVIPVILPGYEGADPDLPPFLRSFTWVDFRQKQPDPLKTLAWGVTGRR